MDSRGRKTTRRRLIELVLGLFFVLIAVGVTRIWIELKNSRRADSYALRQSVALTFQAANQYGINKLMADDFRLRWTDYLDTPLGQKVPTKQAHEFLDLFMISYQDGILDSAEVSALLQQLTEFQPVID